MYKLLVALLVATTAMQVQAKDLEVVVKNNSALPANIHYNFTVNPIDKNEYNIRGDLKTLQPNAEHSLHKVGIEDGALVNIHIDKVSIGNRTVIDAPCQFDIPNNRDKAEIEINLDQGPDGHGTLGCSWN